MSVSLFAGGAAAAGYPPIVAEASPASVNNTYGSSGVAEVGVVSISASGGKPGYTYIWQSDSMDIFFDDATAENATAYIDAVFSNAYSGNIYCTVTDSRGHQQISNPVPFALDPVV